MAEVDLEREQSSRPLTRIALRSCRLSASSVRRVRHSTQLALAFATVGEMNHQQDPDDWFEDSEPAPQPQTAPGDEGAPDDWLHDANPPPSRPLRTRVDRRILLLAAVAVALLLIGLAAAGVFSSGTATIPPAVTSTPTSTNTITQPTTTPPARSQPPPTATLKPGDTGAQVKRLQHALTTLGYSTGKIDGQYGPATEAAVKRFQRSNRLTADGIVGPKTLAAIASALSRG